MHARAVSVSVQPFHSGRASQPPPKTQTTSALVLFLLMFLQVQKLTVAQRNKHFQANLRKATTSQLHNYKKNFTPHINSRSSEQSEKDDHSLKGWNSIRFTRTLFLKHMSRCLRTNKGILDCPIVCKKENSRIITISP